MQKPERIRVFEKLILAARAEYELAESRWMNQRAPAFGFLFDYASGQPPMANRANHVFADAEGYYCVLFSKYARVGSSGVSCINSFFHPAITEYEGFMPREGKGFWANHYFGESLLFNEHISL